MNSNHFKPSSWTELFEFVRFSRTKDMLQQYALERAKAMQKES